MKILAYRHDSDFNFERILQALAKTKYQIGYTGGDIKKEHISEFNPDIIIHNIPDAESFPIKSNAVSININETDAKNSFSFKNTNAKNYIEPFVSVQKTEITEEDKNKYQSDVVYIGSPSIFESILNFLTDPLNNVGFKFFTYTPHNINGYCGSCNPNDYYKIYNTSKTSLVMQDDISRIMDIVASNGNPIVYNKNNADECIAKIQETINTGVRHIVNGFDKDDIIQKHTSFDRASKIFKTVGLNKIAEEILKQKNGSW